MDTLFTTLGADATTRLWPLAAYAATPDIDEAFDIATDKVINSGITSQFTSGSSPTLLNVNNQYSTPRVLTFIQALRSINSFSENKLAFPLGSSSHIQSTPNSNIPGEEAPTTPIILCCPYYKKSAFYNISTVVSIENLALTLPLAGPVAFPSSALSSTLQKALEDYTWTTDLSKKPLDGLESLLLDNIILRKRKIRSKVTTQRNNSTRIRSFIVMHNDTLIAALPTLTEAKKAAATAAKSSSHDDGTWRIYTIYGKAPLTPNLDDNNTKIDKTVCIKLLVSNTIMTIPHPLQTVIKSRTSQKGVFRISGTLVKATPPKKNVGWIFAVPLTSK